MLGLSLLRSTVVDATIFKKSESSPIVGVDAKKNFGIMLTKKERMKMNPEFTIEELKMMHLSLISRERVLRKDYIPHERDAIKQNALVAEADAVRTLGRKVCAAQLSMELGFYIEPLAEGV